MDIPRRLFLLAAVSAVARSGDLTPPELVARYTAFCAAYDAVGEAANTFARAYNLGKGTLWPLRESRQLESAQVNYERAFHRLYCAESWISTKK